MARRKPTPWPVRAVQAVVLAYIVAVWVLPILLMAFLGFSPHIVETPLAVRLGWSAAGSVVALGLLVASEPGRFTREYRRQSQGHPIKHPLLLLAGVLLFTWTGAALWSNVQGPLSRLLPAEPFEQRVVLSSVSDSGWRFSHTDLEFADPADGRTRYLAIDKPVLRPSGFAAGQTVLLRGDRGPLGRHVNSISVVP